ncbi:uncharacterized protein METZ01_LOCUS268198 [marine metagenome]|uniref:Uncharacterized protein n=1 Tax=marine metagenome TaxID=408172 RepID=A0A382JS96_9ZZZZ
MKENNIYIIQIRFDRIDVPNKTKKCQFPLMKKLKQSNV